MGEIVTDRLEENFSDLMNYDFTAQMEDHLDHVANNQENWKAVLDAFFTDFSQQLEVAEKIQKKEECDLTLWLLLLLNVLLVLVIWELEQRRQGYS